MDTHLLRAADTVGPGGGYLYESPIWDHRRGVWLWVDIEAGHVHELEPSAGAHRRHELGGPVSCVALREAGGYVIAKAHSLVTVDERFDAQEVAVGDLGFAKDVRFNDGAVAADGALWIGTLSHLRSGAGTLLRVDGRLRIDRVVDGVSISNGIDWTADGARQYYVDSGAHTVDLLDVEINHDGATLRGRTTLLTLASPETPDGLAADAEGHVWVACWGGSRVVRVSPDGVIVAELRVPAPHVSSVAFGGEDLRDVFITTAREDLDAAQLAAQPLSGSVFRWRAPVPGLPARMWAG